MVIIMELKTVLSELQTRFGFQNLTSDVNGVYSVLVNKKFTLNLAESTDHASFFMYADIVALHPDIQARLLVYERTLTANLFGKETNDAYFAYDNKRGMIVLIKRFDVRLTDYALFFEEFRDFISSLSYWDQIVIEGLMNPSTVQQKNKQESFIDTRKIV